MEQAKSVAIVLAAGQGKRMNSNVPKQYLMLRDKPVLYYSLKVFEESSVDYVVLVVGKGDVEYCKNEIVDKYKFKKVIHIVEGGKERYHSVYNGLCNILNSKYVLIHDGARPFITTEMISNVLKEVVKTKACIVGMPVKDTIKIVDENKTVVETPDRSFVWVVQTPQVFEYQLIMKAYHKLMKEGSFLATDDAMVLEQMLGYPVQLVEGAYSNIKITTPEDIRIAEAFLDGKE